MPQNIIELKPQSDHLHGATLGQDDLAPLTMELSRPASDPVVLLLNLSGVVSVSASYLRSTLYWAYLCGQADVQEKKLGGGSDPWAIRPIPIFPVVEGGSLELVSDVDDFFRNRGLPLLLITKRTNTQLKEARLLGGLDNFLQSTLQKLSLLREATAGQLAEANPEKITVNGWSNRLADLYLLRLVTRTRNGKYWLYSPLVEEIILWA